MNWLCIFKGAAGPAGGGTSLRLGNGCRSPVCSQAGASGRVGVSTGRALAALTPSAQEGELPTLPAGLHADPPCASTLQGWLPRQGCTCALQCCCRRAARTCGAGDGLSHVLAGNLSFGRYCAGSCTHLKCLFARI